MPHLSVRQPCRSVRQSVSWLLL